MVPLLLLTGLLAVRAEDAEDKYLRIYAMIEKADALAKSGQVEQAKAKYEAAHTALWDLKKVYPTFNAKAVAFRLGYLEEKISALSNPASARASETAGEAKPVDRTNAPGNVGLGEVEVKLLSPGAEPRKSLRLHPKAGDKQTLAMSVKVSMDVQVGEMPGQEMKMPAMNLAMETSVKDISADGDITFETVIVDCSVSEEPGVMPQVAEAVKTSMNGIKGLATAGTMSSRGLSKSSETKVPADAAPQLRQSLDQLKESLATAAVPLPEAPIGPGAKWQVTVPLKSQGMTIDQTATYELVAMDGDQLTLKSAIVQHAVNQKIQNPMMPTMKVDVSKMTGNATGESKLDLSSIVPVLTVIDSHSETAMSMNIGGQKQAMTMKTETNVRLESK